MRSLCWAMDTATPWAVVDPSAAGGRVRRVDRGVWIGPGAGPSEDGEAGEGREVPVFGIVSAGKCESAFAFWGSWVSGQRIRTGRSTEARPSTRGSQADGGAGGGGTVEQMVGQASGLDGWGIRPSRWCERPDTRNPLRARIQSQSSRTSWNSSTMVGWAWRRAAAIPFP